LIRGEGAAPTTAKSPPDIKLSHYSTGLAKSGNNGKYFRKALTLPVDLSTVPTSADLRISLRALKKYR